MRISLQMAFAIMLMSPAIGAQPTSDDPNATNAPTSYQSAFADYRPFRESETPPQASWRAINDQVARGSVGQTGDDGEAANADRSDQQHQQHHQ